MPDVVSITSVQGTNTKFGNLVHHLSMPLPRLSFIINQLIIGKMDYFDDDDDDKDDGNDYDYHHYGKGNISNDDN